METLIKVNNHDSSSSK